MPLLVPLPSPLPTEAIIPKPLPPPMEFLVELEAYCIARNRKIRKENSIEAAGSKQTLF